MSLVSDFSKVAMAFLFLAYMSDSFHLDCIPCCGVGQAIEHMVL